MQKHWRYTVATAAAAILTTACQMDPVAFGDSAEHPSPFDDLPEVAASSAGASVPRLVDPTRPRFRIAFSVVEATLTPGASTAVTLHGEAVEDLTGGTVTVTLPTMAAMANVTAGAKPYYPTGQSYPVAGKWTLPAMSAGDTWQNSVAVPLPAKAGYYHLSVEIDTDVAAGKRDAFVNDEDIFYERWILVTADGGRLTTGLDPSAFASDSIAPAAGPFRNKARYGGGAAAAAYGDFGVMYSSSGPVRKNIVYNTGGGRSTAAVGANAFAALYQGSGPDIELVASYSRTVPASGIVSFPCPPSGHWLEGGVSLPATGEVAAGTLIAYWDAHPGDCNTTSTEEGDRHDYMPWYNLKSVSRKLEDLFNVNVPRIKWRVNHSEEYSSYDPDLHRVDFGSATYDRKWTAAHEYAHGLHHKKLGGLWNTEQVCYSHADRHVWRVSGYRCALLEGFADYAANKAIGYHPLGRNWENPKASTNDNDEDPNPEIEGYVAALLWDLTDSANDGNDQTNYSVSSVGTAFKTCDIFVTGWAARNDVSDFVWCMEDRINSTLHEDHFSGVPTPTNQNATRGSGWNADHIRSTWLQNLTN